MTKTIFLAVAPFYKDIADMLIEGAVAEINKEKMKYEVHEVAGALEIPMAIGLAIESGNYDGYVALGCVIRGETSHYETVANESARGLMNLSLEYLEPIGNGILTVENFEQAKVRASISQKNKGGEAVKACIGMMKLREKLLPAND